METEELMQRKLRTKVAREESPPLWGESIPCLGIAEKSGSPLENSSHRWKGLLARVSAIVHALGLAFGARVTHPRGNIARGQRGLARCRASRIGCSARPATDAHGRLTRRRRLAHKADWRQVGAKLGVELWRLLASRSLAILRPPPLGVSRGHLQLRTQLGPLLDGLVSGNFAVRRECYIDGLQIVWDEQHQRVRLGRLQREHGVVCVAVSAKRPYDRRA
mmetsp:Transcript_2558/g.7690  ORF Transcript_2558/g.7690 Transcript_2558/m.7690 type:complete len:220 (-) Transcript_2558:1910-2569(-)